MDAEIVNALAEKAGVEPPVALAALKLANDIPQDAEKFLAEDLCAVKGTYCASTNKIYGGFIALFDTDARKLIRSRIIATYDAAIGNIPLTRSWNEIEQGVFGAEMRHNFIPPMTNDLKAEFISSLESNMHAYLSSALESDYSRLGDMIRKFIMETLGDQDVQVTAASENLSVAELKLIDKEVDVSDLGASETAAAPEGEAGATGAEGAEGEEAQRKQVTLKTDIILSPVSGVPAAKLNPGDYIMVKIVDSRPQATYIANLLHAIENGRAVPIKAPIKKIEKSGSERLVITTEFGPGVFGRTILSAGVKIQSSTAEAQLPMEAKLPSDRGPIILLIAAGLVVIALAIIVIFLFLDLV